MYQSNHLRRSRSFLLAATLLYLALSSSAYAQSSLKIYGQVFDNSGPVGNVLVQINNTPFKAITDEQGYYKVYDIPPGKYRLGCYSGSRLISSTGTIIIKCGLAVRQDIYLDQDIVNLQAVYVEADISQSLRTSGNRVIVYTVDRKEVASIEDVIEQIPGLNLVKSQATGEAYISAGGMRPEGVEVLIDGRRLNSLLTGRADINQLPLKAIAQVEYYSPGTHSSGDGGIAGTVNFITTSNFNPDLIDIDIIRGSYTDETYSALISYDQPKRGKLSVIGETGYVRNDFEYTDYFGDTQTRVNAASKHNKYYLAYTNTLFGTNINLSGLIYDRENGVPGRITTPSAEAVSEKHTSSLGINAIRMFGKSFTLELSSSYNERKMKYRDYSSWIPYDNSYYEREYDIDINAAQQLYQNLIMSSGLSYTNGLLNGVDHIPPDSSLDRCSRDIYKAYADINFRKRVDNFNFDVGLSYEHSNVESKNYSTGSAGATITYCWLIDIGVSSAYGHAFRLPGLAELYWKEDVFTLPNPQLSPERSNSLSTELFSEFKLWGKWRVSTEYKDVRYTDLIYWRRSQGVKYKPVNVSSSDFFCTTSILAYRSPGDYLIVDFSHEHSVPLNREDGTSYYGKYITFQPLYTNRLSVKLSYKNPYVKAEMVDVSKRYYNEDNIKSLRPYTLVNLSLGFELSYKIIATSWLFEIRNLTDAEYEHLEYQPNAPRTFYLGFNLKI